MSIPKKSIKSAVKTSPTVRSATKITKATAPATKSVSFKLLLDDEAPKRG